MKFGKKLAAITVSAALLASAGALAACSGGNNESEANLSGAYTASKLTFFTAYPTATYKQVTTAVQSIETYDDGTYVITVTTKSLSGDLAFDPSDAGVADVSGVNDRGQTLNIYYGTYTSTEEEGLLTLVLSAPVDMISSTAGSYISTLAWTDAMGQAAAGEGNAALTEEQYIEQNGYAETTVVVDAANYTFTYISEIGPELRSGSLADMRG